MRVRAALLIPLTCGALMAFAGAASALQIGPVHVSVPVPPVPVPPIPALAPVLGTKPIELPDATVNVSPNDGVAIGVTIPASVGPVSVPPAVPRSVQVTVDPSGIAVTTTPVRSGPAPVAPSPAAALPTASAPAGSSPAPVSPAPSSPVDSSPMSGAQRATIRSVTNPSHSAVQPSTPAVVAPPAAIASDPVGHSSTPSGAAGAPAPGDVVAPGAVNASLQHAAPGGSFTLAREVVSGRFALWLALLAALGVAHWALSGLVRDARRRARPVSSA